MSQSEEEHNTREVQPDIVPDYLRHAVDEVLQEYCASEPRLSFFSAAWGNSETETKGEDKIMRSKYRVFREMNTELWHKAFETCIFEITETHYPHYNAAQKLIDYTLNSKSIDEVLIKTFFTKLTIFHPPNSLTMQNYYSYILNERYVSFNIDRKIEPENIFWCIIEVIKACLEYRKSSTGDIPESSRGRQDSHSDSESSESEDENQEKNYLLELNYKLETCFQFLPLPDKLHRVIFILECLYEILEVDFVYRLKQQQFETDENRCLLSELLWKKVEEAGTTNSNVRKILYVYKLMEESPLTNGGELHRKLLILMAETIRLTDRMKNLYPFLGDNTDKLASGQSLNFIDGLREGKERESIMSLNMLEPDWLRLLICSKLLSYIIGKPCTPDLSAIHDILKDIESLPSEAEMSELGNMNEYQKPSSSQGYEEYENFDVGVQYCCSFCTLNQFEMETMVWRETDINAVDDKGWAALHRAILLGHEKCVEQLVSSQTKSPENTDIVLNARVKGFNNLTPLMCAVIKKQRTTCRLLLEHFGPDLLDDVDVKGKTPFDMCQDKDIEKVMNSFTMAGASSESTQILGLKSNMILVIELCVMLAGSYLSTYKTRDVLERLKTPSMDDSEFRQSEKSFQFDYPRYENDINVNLVKLSEIAKTFERREEFKKAIKPLKLVLSSDIKF